LVKKVIIGGVVCEFEVLGESTLIAVVPRGSFREKTPPGPQTVTLITSSEAKTSTDTVSFDRSRELPPSSPSVTVQRDPLGHVTNVTVEGDDDLTPKELLEAIRAVLQSEHCCPEKPKDKKDGGAGGKEQQKP
jgi:hypothetical protein